MGGPALERGAGGGVEGVEGEGDGTGPGEGRRGSAGTGLFGFAAGGHWLRGGGGGGEVWEEYWAVRTSLTGFEDG